MNDMVTTPIAEIVELPLSMIDPDPSNVRRIPDPAADEKLRISVAERGVDVPILVRPIDGRYQIVYGERRYRAALAAGHEAIPGIVRALDDASARASQVTENLVRASMHVVDQWRTIDSMVKVGYTIEAAARALGITPRRVQQLQKLGHIHPPILDAMAVEGVRAPSQDSLFTIANAPIEVQISAFEKHGADWFHLERACLAKRISLETAIFDRESSGVVFQEDIFAEPGSSEQWTTDDVTGFAKAQQAAIEAKVKASKGRVMLGKIDQYGQQVDVPKGYQRVYGEVPAKFKKDDPRVVFVAMATGYEYGKVVEVMARPLAAKAGTDAGSPGRSSGAADNTPPPRGPISKAGQDMIAKAKREAIQTQVRAYASNDPDTEQGSTNMLAILLLAVTAPNVEIHGEPGTGHALTSLADLRGRLVDANGLLLRDLDVWAVREVAAEAIERMVVFDSPLRTGDSSGAAAEWIGAALNAHPALPRFDTPEFLEHVNADTLRTIAAGMGEKSSGTAKALRERLAGNAPNWRPPGTVFAAPGPKAGGSLDEAAWSDDAPNDPGETEAADDIDPDEPIAED